MKATAIKSTAENRHALANLRQSLISKLPHTRFVRLVSLPQSALEQLALSGAFDCFGSTRRQALWEVLALVNTCQGELSLELEPVKDSREKIPAMSTGEEIASDFKSMGLSPGQHPMTLLRKELTGQGILNSNDLYAKESGTTVNVAGVVVIRQRPMTAKGFMFITLEDEFGCLNIVVKPDIFKKQRETLIMNNALIVRRLLEKRDGVINVIGKVFTALSKPGSSDKISIKSRDFR
ncbi:MAG: hypothetical protein P1R58_06155 [bacterium]|nr:hypothetical protein [bacterium]